MSDSTCLRDAAAIQEYLRHVDDAAAVLGNVRTAPIRRDSAAASIQSVRPRGQVTNQELRPRQGYDRIEWQPTNRRN